MENEQFESCFDRAYEFDEQEEPEKALNAINEAIEFDPSSAEAHNFRGILLEKLERKEDAVVAYETAVQLDPDSMDAVENLSGLKDELEKEQMKNSRSQQALRGAGIGAYTFGMSFVIYEVLSYWLVSLKSFPPIPLPTNLTDVTTFVMPVELAPDIYDYLILLLRVLACGIGLGFINRDINKKSFWSGFLVGFLGCGIGELLFRFNSPIRSLWFPHSLVGIFVGLLFGLSYKNVALLIPFSLAGGISFGLEPTIVNFSLTLVSDNFLGTEKLTLILVSILIGLIGGGLKGFAFGWVAEWFSTRDQTPAIITSKGDSNAMA